MSCPFANVSFHGSNEVTESQKISYKIYDMEAEILKTTKHLEILKEARKRLEEEDEMERLGTVENVEKEFNKIFGDRVPFTRTTLKKQLKPLLASIVYTLKDFNKRLNEEKVHVHNENIPLKFTKLPEKIPCKEEHCATLFAADASCPPPPCESNCPDEMDKIWAANSTEFEIGDEKLVAEVLSGFTEVPDHRIEFDPKDATTYCSDKPDDNFTFSTHH